VFSQAPRLSAAYPRSPYTANRIAPGAVPRSSNRPSGISTVRPAFYHSNRNGRPFAHRRGVAGAGYPYAAGYADPGYLTYDGPYTDDSTDADAPTPPDSEQPEIDPSANLVESPQPTAARARQPDPAPAEAVTLVFKDGRPSQQIRNFIATRSTISVFQGQRHYDIPVADLDLAATAKANRNAGVDFSLPAGTP